MSVIEPTRELFTYAVNSGKWDDFPFREGDIVIATYSKSGTTLTQQIVSQLLSNGAEEGLGQTQSPWVDCCFAPDSRQLAEDMPGRRFLKSHLPADALPIDSRAKYVNVGRDPRDVFWSWHNHHLNFTEAFYAFADSQPGHEDIPWDRPDPDIRKAYLGWIRGGEGEHHGGYWDFAKSWWDLRDEPNVQLFHFNQYKADLEASIREIAAFLKIDFDEDRMPAILEHCSIEHMRKATKGNEFFDMIWKEGGKSFFNKGTNGRWKDLLTEEEIALADEKIDENLPPDCAHWLRTGEMPG